MAVFCVFILQLHQTDFFFLALAILFIDHFLVIDHHLFEKKRWYFSISSAYYAAYCFSVCENYYYISPTALNRCSV